MPSGSGDRPVAGSPALTRHRVGSGWAYYLATHLEGPDLDALVGRLVDESGTSLQYPGEPVEVALDDLRPGWLRGWSRYAAGVVWAYHRRGLAGLVRRSRPPSGFPVIGSG